MKFTQLYMHFNPDLSEYANLITFITIDIFNMCIRLCTIFLAAKSRLSTMSFSTDMRPYPVINRSQELLMPHWHERDRVIQSSTGTCEWHFIDVFKITYEWSTDMKFPEEYGIHHSRRIITCKWRWGRSFSISENPCDNVDTTLVWRNYGVIYWRPMKWQQYAKWKFCIAAYIDA